MSSFEQIAVARHAYGLSETDAPDDVFLSMTASTDPDIAQIENYFGHPHIQAGIISAARKAGRSNLFAAQNETSADIISLTHILSATVLRHAS